MPSDATLLPAVWQMKRKPCLKTRAVRKYKARLNVDGLRQVQGRDYKKNYAPVASWPSIRLLLTLATVHNWKTTQLDYVLAFLQAPIEQPLYMKVSAGFNIEHGTTAEYVLRLKRNIYGQRQAGRVWHTYHVEKLASVGFIQSEHDPCVFFCGSVM